MVAVGRNHAVQTKRSNKTPPKQLLHTTLHFLPPNWLCHSLAHPLQSHTCPTQTEQGLSTTTITEHSLTWIWQQDVTLLPTILCPSHQGITEKVSEMAWGLLCLGGLLWLDPRGCAHCWAGDESGRLVFRLPREGVTSPGHVWGHAVPLHGAKLSLWRTTHLPIRGNCTMYSTLPSFSKTLVF